MKNITKKIAFLSMIALFILRATGTVFAGDTLRKENQNYDQTVARIKAFTPTSETNKFYPNPPRGTSVQIYHNHETFFHGTPVL